MTQRPSYDTTTQMDKLATTASALGYEIVDIAGFLDMVDGLAKDQQSALISLTSCANDMTQANSDVMVLVQNLNETADQARIDVQTSVTLVRNVGEKSRDVAGWVNSIRERSETVADTLRAVNTNNSQIAAIAAQVNTLAINAKIEAARAGDAGRGFAVVAEAINDLSQKTSVAAKQITENIKNLTEWISDLGREAEGAAENADVVLNQSSETDAALSRMEASIEADYRQGKEITTQTGQVKDAVDRLRPAVLKIEDSVKETTSGIKKTHARVADLIEASEQIVQLCAGLGGTSADGPFVGFVQETAIAISQGLERAVEAGEISKARLFDQYYRPIQGTSPQQLTTQATAFLEKFLPQFQEPALEFDEKVVFCALVDTNGYLPTHNRKFSQPQRCDVVWNTANCRNGRIFDDRVGLKAGRNTAPFLLQVYRRDMGGGEFCVMKDLCAPVHVGGRHWGGLRLAYRY
jgi:methyl-accepting chemotaxis protein